MPTSTKSVAEYRERAKKLRLAAENTVVAETREQLLVVAEDYEDLAEGRGLIEGQSAD